MTQNDLNQIGNIIDKKFDERLGKLEDKFDEKFKEQDKKLGKKFDEQDKKFDEKFKEQDKKLGKKFDEQDKKFDKKLDERDSRLFFVMSELIDVKLDNNNHKLEDKLFKWKSEVIDAVDSLATEMKDSQDFREITTHQIVANRERTDRLEKKVFGVVSSV